MEEYTVKLRELRPQDLNLLVKLANNKEIWKNLRDVFPHPYTEEDGKNFIALVQSDKSKQRNAIEVNGQFAGMIGIFPQNDVNRYTAEIGYWLGEPYWGKGIMSKAINLICKDIFEKTDLNRIFAAVFSYNLGSARALEKNGFKYEGTGRQAVFKDGAFYDDHRWSILKEEFLS